MRRYMLTYDWLEKKHTTNFAILVETPKHQHASNHTWHESWMVCNKPSYQNSELLSVM